MATSQEEAVAPRRACRWQRAGGSVGDPREEARWWWARCGATVPGESEGRKFFFFFNLKSDLQSRFTNSVAWLCFSLFSKRKAQHPTRPICSSSAGISILLKWSLFAIWNQINVANIKYNLVDAAFVSREAVVASYRLASISQVWISVFYQSAQRNQH